FALLVILGGVLVALPHSNAVKAAPGVKQSPAVAWSTYMFNSARSGYNGAETNITVGSAPNLKLHWRLKEGGLIFSQPVVANGLIYTGTFQGNEIATNLTGKLVWQQNLGSVATCAPVNPLGVVSTAAVATVAISGTSTSVVYVG